MYRIVSYFLILTLFTNLFSQQSEGGTPLSFKMNSTGQGSLKSASQLKQIIVGPVDNEEEIRHTDSINQKTLRKLGFYGKLLDADIDLVNDIDPVETEDGYLFLYHIISPGAFGLQFFFDNFNLPDNGRLFIYNEEKDMVLGAFTDKNNNERRNFGTQYIKGSSVFIEYFVPKESRIKSSLHIDKVVHVFRPVFTAIADWGRDQECFVDLACEEDAEWRRMGASVALILSVYEEINYAYWCTGFLLNNTSYDRKPYFMTAAHCADTARVIELETDTSRFDYSTWLFIFNYLKKNCNDNKAPATNQSVYGSKALSYDNYIQDSAIVDRYVTDHLLLELNTSPEVLKRYNVIYAGWDINEDSAYYSEYVKSIHHPVGNAKKISTSDPVFSGSMSPDPDVQWVTHWFSGTTDYGSSGSPLFNDKYKVIGHLHGGGGSCSMPDSYDFYNKFSLSYNMANLQQWLDPAGTGVETIGPLKQEIVETEESPVKMEYDKLNNEITLYILEPINNGSIIDLSICDITGRIVFSGRYAGENILRLHVNISVSGLYFLVMDYNFKTLTKKLLITKH